MSTTYTRNLYFPNKMLTETNRTIWGERIYPYFIPASRQD